jgi:hypothetical protein
VQNHEQALGQQVTAAAQVHNATLDASNESSRVTGTDRFYSSEAQDIFGEGFFTLRVQMIQPVTLVSTGVVSMENVTTMLEAGFQLQTGGESQFLRLLTTADANFRTVLSIKIRRTSTIYQGPVSYAPSPTVPPTTAAPVPHVKPTTRPTHRPKLTQTKPPSRAPSPNTIAILSPTKVPPTDEPTKNSQSVPTLNDRDSDGLLNGAGKPSHFSSTESEGDNQQDSLWIAAMAGGSATFAVSCFLLCCLWCRRRDIDRHETKRRTVYERYGQSSIRTAYIVPDVVELDDDHQSLANTSLGEQTAGRYTPKRYLLQQEPNVTDIRPLKALGSFDENSLYTTPFSTRPDDSSSNSRTPSTRTPSSLASYRIGTLEFGDSILSPMSDATTDSNSEEQYATDPYSIPELFAPNGGPIYLDTEGPIYAPKGKNSSSRPGITTISANDHLASGLVDEGSIGLDTENPYAASRRQVKASKILPLSSTTIRDSKKHFEGKPRHTYQGPIDLDTLKPYSSKNSKHPGVELQECYGADSGTEVESQPDEEKARQVSKELEDSLFDLNTHMDECSSGLAEFDNDSHFSSEPPQPSSPSYSSKSTAKIGNTARSLSTRLATAEEESESSFGSMEEEGKCDVSDEHRDTVKSIGAPSRSDRADQAKRRIESLPSPTHDVNLTTNSRRFQTLTTEASSPSQTPVLSPRGSKRIVPSGSQSRSRNSEPWLKQHQTSPSALLTSPYAQIHNNDGELESTPLQHNHYIPIVTPEVQEEDEEEASDLDSASEDSEPDGSGVLGMQAREDELSSVSSGISPWIFDALEQTLGPRSVTADLESLGGGSANKSRTSRTGGDVESVTSGASSRMSYCSSSVARRGGASLVPRTLEHDLRRLQLDLSAVLDSDQMTTSSVTVPSLSGNSLSTTIHTRNRAPQIIGRMRFVVDVPPGKLGVILANRHDGKGTIVMDVRNNSSLKGRLSPGDKLMAVDGLDVTEMVVSQITSLMASKAGQEQRRLTFISSVAPDQRDFSESKTDVRNY